MSPDLLSDLNDSQRQAVTHPGGPLLILAGAGSGKTRALTYRAAYLIMEKKLAPERLLLTTFTNKAAQEMQLRLESLVHQRLPFAGTFHSLCARILRRHGPAIDLDRDFLIYDDDDQLSLIKKILKSNNLDPKEHRPRTYLSQIESCKQELVSASEYQSIARGPNQQSLALIYHTYETQLKENNALDFNDLLMKTVQLLRTQSKVLDYYQNQFIHVLIDEYQDTNKSQYHLTKLLSGKHHNLTVVGDASQAIYSWRGADYHNLLSLKNDFPELTTIKLEQNYRSTQNILDAAHGVIGNNTRHPILTLFTQKSGQGDQVTIKELKDEYAESRYLLETIQSLRRTYPHLKLKDFVVLYRTNAQSRVLEEVFLGEGVPYILVGGVKFYERKEVKDVLSYLRLFHNPRDQVSRDRLQKLGKRQLVTFESWAAGFKSSLAPLPLLQKILEVTNYLDRYDQDIPEDAARIENVNELFSVAQNFSTLTEFLENVALVEQDTLKQGWVTPNASISLAEAQDAVIFMTLHASKGLEFDTVFMIGLEEGLFPHSRSLFTQEALEEERRLCYVGMTRAKHRLYLTYAQSRIIFGSRNQNPPSRFLSEIPDTVLSASPLPQPSAKEDALLDLFLQDEIDIDAFLHS